MRLRILDINTPFVWVTVFYQRRYGEPFLTASLWKPHTFQKFWIHFWKWEELPKYEGKEAILWPAPSAKQEGGE